MRKLNFITYALLAGIPLFTFASPITSMKQTLQTQAKQIASQQQALHKTQQFHTQTNQSSSSEQNLFSVSVQEEYSRWGLTKEDWVKYKKLSKLERSYWSPNLDPLTLLGVEAETEAERMKYARLLARKEFNRVEKEIAFQKAYDKAFKELYPNEKMFAMNNSPQALAELAKKDDKARKIVLFVSLNCASCETAWREVNDYRLSHSLPVDIFFVGDDATDVAIRQWAVSNNIDRDEVKNKKITLNYDRQGLWLKYSKQMPSAFAVNGKGYWKNLGNFN